MLKLAPELLALGWELVNHPNADLIAHHAGSGKGHTDVAICHGFHPTGMDEKHRERWHDEINARVAQDILSALEVTVPSEWVADIVRRDFHIEPHVIHWTANFDEWENQGDGGYVFWGKNRSDAVCNPVWIERLAEAFPTQQFYSTFGRFNINLRVEGRTLSREEFREALQNCQIYLSTTKETGDIAAKEALACGKPVLGFRQGALPDFVHHGVNGFLAEPDDFEGLAKGLLWLQTNYSDVSKAAIKHSKGSSWKSVAEQFAEVFDRALFEKMRPKTVSVVIPCHNYADFVTKAAESALNQTHAPDKVILVNDASNDNSLEVIKGIHTKYPDKIEFMDFSNNIGVANARNYGISTCGTDYVVCLDADDQIADTFIERCFDALERDRRASVAYTRLLEINSGVVSQWLAGHYDYMSHTQGHNQVPTCAMFKVKDWERVGGYIQAYHPAEDAEFWLRMLTFCGHAVKASHDALFLYNMHQGSASQRLRPIDWLGDKGWLSKGHFPAAVHKGIEEGVRNYDNPDISVIIPVGTGHEHVVKQAIRSIENQSFWSWEIIVVSDSRELKRLPASPYVKIISTTFARKRAKQPKGAGFARNLGLNEARGKAVLFLDADDTLRKDALEQMWYALRKYGGYIYSDYNMIYEDGRVTMKRTPEFTPAKIYTGGIFHPISALIPTQYVRDIEGFDAQLVSWEDTDFFMKLIRSGICGTRINEPLLDYHIEKGQRRNIGAAEAEKLISLFNQRYDAEVNKGEIPVCLCHKPKQDPRKPKDGDLVEVVYMGAKGNHTLRINGTNYGQRQHGDRFYIHSEDYDEHRFNLVPQLVELPEVRTVMPA